MNNALKFILGSTRYRVTTPFPARIAGKLMSAFPEYVFDVSVFDNYSLEFSCVLYACKKVENCEILKELDKEKIGGSGLSELLLKYKRRYGLAIGIIFFILILSLSSNVVWDIRIKGNSVVSDEEIKSTLSDLGFSEGTFIASSDLSDVVNRFIILEKRVSWISINMSGTVAFVEIKERSMKTDSDDNPSMSGILSSSDCIIELCEVTSGTSLVKAGDTVYKGQMIISPVAIGKDGNEYFAGARGKVYARTYEEFMVEEDYYNQVAHFTGRKLQKNNLSLLGKNITILPFSASKFDNYLCLRKSGKITLSEDIILPIHIITLEMFEYTVADQIITPEEAKKLAYGKMYSKISECLGDAEIVSTQFSEIEGSESFVLKCRVECIRNVAENRN